MFNIMKAKEEGGFRCRIRTKKRGDEKEIGKEKEDKARKNGGREGKEEEKEMDEELERRKIGKEEE